MEREINKCIIHYTFYTVFTHSLTFSLINLKCSRTPVTSYTWRLMTVGLPKDLLFHRKIVKQKGTWHLGGEPSCFGIDVNIYLVVRCV